MRNSFTNLLTTLLILCFPFDILAQPSSCPRGTWCAPPNAKEQTGEKSQIISVKIDGDFWTDQKSGLTWSTCPIGRKYTRNHDGYSCELEVGLSADGAKFTWYDAIAAAEKSKLGGHDDWRIPTIKELLTLLKCEDEKWQDWGHSSKYSSRAREREPNRWVEMDISSDRPLRYCRAYSEDLKFFYDIWTPEGVWTSSPPPPGYKDSSFNDEYIPDAKKYLPRVKYENWKFDAPLKPQFVKAEVLMVRGGDGEEWGAARSDARKISRLIANEESQYKRERDAQISKDLRIAEDSRRKSTQERQATQENLERETQRLRKSVKVGDTIAVGLAVGVVIEVKGDDIRVQTYENRCVQRYSDGSCQKTRREPSGEGWTKRANLVPARPF